MATCTVCDSTSLDGRKICVRCRRSANDTRSQRSWRRRRAESGICVRCGNAPLATTTMCQECRDKQNAKMRALNVRRREERFARQGPNKLERAVDFILAHKDQIATELNPLTTEESLTTEQIAQQTGISTATVTSARLALIAAGKLDKGTRRRIPTSKHVMISPCADAPSLMRAPFPKYDRVGIIRRALRLLW